MSSKSRKGGNKNTPTKGGGGGGDAAPRISRSSIPVGIDLGSLHARVAIASSGGGGSGDSSSSSSGGGGGGTSSTQGGSDVPVHLVSNQQGSRQTVALSTYEHHHEMNYGGGGGDDIVVENGIDGVLENGTAMTNGNSNSNQQKHIVYGDAARKSLQMEKKKIDGYLVQSMIRRLGERGEDDGTTTEEEREAWKSLSQSFLGHMAQLASDASAVPMSDLRFVLSVPVLSGGGSSSSYKYVDALVKCVEESVRPTPSLQQQQQASAPSSKSKKGGKGNKQNKQQQQQSPVKNGGGKKKKGQSPVVIGVISDAAAVCVAHGLTDASSSSSSQADDEKECVIVLPPPQSVPITNGGSKPTTTTSSWNTCVVIDWGASGLTVTKFQRLPQPPTNAVVHHQPSSSKNNNKNQTVLLPNLMTAIQIEHDTKSSGHAITEMICKHLATTFARKTKLPIDEIVSSKKAYAKLVTSSEQVIQTLAQQSTSNAHVSIDGLYEGMDLHASISRPRFDMLLGPVLRSAKTILSKVITTGGTSIDVVLTSGHVCDMPSVQKLIGDVLKSSCNGDDAGQKEVWRGDPTVPVEEAVAIGCARHAAALCSSPTTTAQLPNNADATATAAVTKKTFGFETLLLPPPSDEEEGGDDETKEEETNDVNGGVSKKDDNNGQKKTLSPTSTITSSPQQQASSLEQRRCHHVPIQENLVVSPLEVGLVALPSDDGGSGGGVTIADMRSIVPVIPLGCPLPCTVRPRVKLVGDEGVVAALGIVERVPCSSTNGGGGDGSDDNSNDDNNKAVVVARIPLLPLEKKNGDKKEDGTTHHTLLDLWLDLTADGQLSISLNGGDVVTIGP